MSRTKRQSEALSKTPWRWPRSGVTPRRSASRLHQAPLRFPKRSSTLRQSTCRSAVKSFPSERKRRYHPQRRSRNDSTPNSEDDGASLVYDEIKGHKPKPLFCKVSPGSFFPNGARIAFNPKMDADQI